MTSHHSSNAQQTLRAVLAIAGLICGPVLGPATVVWVPQGFRDLFGIADPPPAPEPPPATYWMSWIIPLAAVIVVCGLVALRWTSSRWFVVPFLIGYLPLTTVVAFVWMGCELGGCGPD
ncbi:hypothetical protein [Gordonia soli]|uniref:Uncharacterized protein n=1 Tax=Gordonia soli NBRC 108243 TaxID=1223545 RepID=M0QF76_9ACTN|nr:hypothetical protein [Gordonia soli]GAC67109.1 hypothetical protein GS4_05_03220 [Gordonia soli NBRC 108243]